MGNPNWVAGHKPTGNRPRGSRNKRTTEAIEAIIAAGHQDPLLTLAEIQAKSSDEGIRATAANMLAPFLHSKCGAMPPLRFITEPVTLPCSSPTTTQELDRNIAHINQLYASGDLDLNSYAALLAGQREHTVSLAREEVPGNTDIHITGGLPELPGTNITMPERPTMNGNHHMIAPPEARLLPDLDPDTAPAIPPVNDGGDQ